ncbi:MAG: apolipoprotein N-acyltransferase [Acidobacteria bacterium]|nr:apolipoprotein N-acyltransferase [Acidobacteriota bacterium]
MQEAVYLDAPARDAWRLKLLARRARAATPTLAETSLAASSAILLVLAFPDFGWWLLAWVGLVPLLLAVARRPRAPQAFLMGWATGTLFFYGSCYWLTYPMIHYAGIPAWLAYPLLLPAPLTAGLFPALCTLALARLVSRLGVRALCFAPFLWAALEWTRLGVIGQLWNAVGYSQAYEPSLIQAARFGGVYAVGFLIVAVNAALAYAILKRSTHSLLKASLILVGIALAILLFDVAARPPTPQQPGALVVAVQPNVIPDFNRPAKEMSALAERHFALSESALRALDEAPHGNAGNGQTPREVRRDDDVIETEAALPRVVVWPESPMNFTYARNSQFREAVSRFARERHTSLLFNSLEPAPDDGAYNAAVFVNEEGRLAVQYDKIRLMPFGEYVPLPRWMPGAGLVRGVVGEFTPGTRFTLMPLGDGEKAPRAGVFICLESAYPYITRRFAEEGADVLIEITNDAYQGDTAVIRQHLANAVFRAVETGRPLLRVTDTGVSARITPRGEVLDATGKFQTATRTWTVARSDGEQTFYVLHGDIFVAGCSLISLVAIGATLRRGWPSSA